MLVSTSRLDGTVQGQPCFTRSARTTRRSWRIFIASSRRGWSSSTAEQAVEATRSWQRSLLVGLGWFFPLSPPERPNKLRCQDRVDSTACSAVDDDHPRRDEAMKMRQLLLV